MASRRALAARAKRRDPSVAYSVYIFHRPDHQNDNHIDHITWEKRHTTWSMRVAYRMAEKLFRSNAYERVEIKMVFFDRKALCRKNKTLKIYSGRSDRPVGMPIGMPKGLWLYALAFFALAALAFWGFRTGAEV